MTRRRHRKPFHHKGHPHKPHPKHAPKAAPAVSHPAAKKEKEAYMEGRLQVRGKFGFVLSEEPGLSDVYVDKDSLKLAMDGDRVLARVTSPVGTAKRAGQIIKVLERTRDTVVGIFKRVRNGEFLIPESGAEPIQVTGKNGLSPQEGQLAVVKITVWPTRQAPASGVLQEVLGWREDPGVDIQALIRKFELPQEFPSEVLAEAGAFGREVPRSALERRILYTHVPVFTIDGAHAKDFDDAVSIEERPEGGCRLGVHIADVAHYVQEGNAMDEEALKRATSVYLVDRVVPMLPPQLSDDLCSLRPLEIRLTLSCVMDLDEEGQVVSHRLFESAIRSVRRFTYEDVETILRGEGTADAPPNVVQDVKRMGELARAIRRRRFQRGSLDFDFPEPEAVLDEQGRPLEIRRRDRLESHRLIEEFMVLANETVASAMQQYPFLYRVHEKPDPAKLTKLTETLRAVGVTVPPGFQEGRSSALQKVLESVKELPVEPMIHTLVLRSMKQAVYDIRNVGHFGLASACYTHFTSPIRRYPDLCVHRVIKEWLHKRLDQERQVHWKRSLPSIATQSSQRERVAQEAERESLDLKRVQLMEKRLGETFEGVISSVTAFGFFVQLLDVFVEGLVHITSLDDDYYIYDELRAALRGRRTHRSFRIGQKVRVKLAGANVLKKQLDFELEKSQGSHDPKKARR